MFEYSDGPVAGLIIGEGEMLMHYPSENVYTVFLATVATTRVTC